MGGENIDFRDEICFSFALVLSPFPPLTLASSCPSEKVARKHGRKRAKDGWMDGWMVKEDVDVVCTYNGILFSWEKEGNPAICDDVDGPWGHSA